MKTLGTFLVIVALVVGLVDCGPSPALQYELTIGSTEGGSVIDPGEGAFAYDEGTVVNLMAVEAEQGYQFVNWTGDVGTIANVDAARTTIFMNGDYSITANFVRVYSLTISSTAGGAVTTPGVGTSTYGEGTVVNLVATPDASHYFAEWTGDVSHIADVFAGSTTITMNDHYSITANFAEVVFTDGLRTMYIDNGVVRVGVDKDWGGAIREIWYNGQNLVNNYGGGRLVGVSLYDGGDTYALHCEDPNWGWNPTPSDKYDHVNPPLVYSFEDSILYVKARNLQWNPDNKGGGPGLAVTSDVVVETWIKFVSHDGRTIALRYKVTHQGVDSHALTGQELSFVCIRTPFPFFVSYTGTAPWTNDAVTPVTPPTWPSHGITASTENWGGFVNSQDEGLVLWSPESYPEFSYVFHDFAPPPENAVYYMLPVTFLEIGPEFSMEFQAYLFLGPWQDARQSIYSLHRALIFPDVLPAQGNVDIPAHNATASGVIQVAGWALDNCKVDTVEIFLDGVHVGQATYGLARPDVALVYPGLSGSPNFGFSYSLDTRKYPNGTRVLEVRAIDPSENTSYLTPRQVVINIQN